MFENKYADSNQCLTKLFLQRFGLPVPGISEQTASITGKERELDPLKKKLTYTKRYNRKKSKGYSPVPKR